MKNDGLILGILNKIMLFSQDKCSYLSENSLFIKNIDNIIFSAIMGVFILSIFTSSDVIGYVALITLFLTILKSFTKKGEQLEMDVFEKFLLAYFLIVVISLAGSSMFHLSLKGFFKTFTYLGFYFSAVQYYKNNLNKIPITIATIAFCAISQGFIGIIQNFSQVGEISTWQDTTNINPEDVLTRVYGTLQPYNPNLFGGYLVASLPCLIGTTLYLLLTKKNIAAYILSGFSLITIIALFMSGCRGAYVGFAVIALCFFAFIAKLIWDSNNQKFKQMYLYTTGMAIALATSAILLISSIRTRIFSIFAMRGDSSTSFRFNVYQSAVQMAKDNWLLGIGVGNQNFREIYGLYMRTGFDALSAYCIFLEIVVESGIFALIAFVGFVIALLNKALRLIIKNKDAKKALTLAIVSTSIIAVLIHGFVDTIFFRPQVQFIFWTMVAILSAIIKSEEKITN